MDEFPSPKSQNHDVGVPVDKSENVTVVPWQNVESFTEKSANRNWLQGVIKLKFHPVFPPLSTLPWPAEKVAPPVALILFTLKYSKQKFPEAELRVPGPRR